MLEMSELDKAHLDALPSLLLPIIECKTSGVPITSNDAANILYKWDQARTPKIKSPKGP